MSLNICVCPEPPCPSHKPFDLKKTTKQRFLY